MNSNCIALVGLLTLTFSSSILAQSSLEGREFTFARIRFESSLPVRGNSGPWGHDHPKAEENLLRFMAAELKMATSPTDRVVLELNDPQISDHPLLFLTEPGYWNPSDDEVSNLRGYLNSGGMIVLDDFRGEGEWDHVVEILQRALPGANFEDLTLEDGPFQAFYSLDSVDLPTPYEVPGKPVARGIRGADGEFRVVAFFNTDLGDFWEWSNSLSHVAPDQIRRCFEIGVNTILYALRQ